VLRHKKKGTYVNFQNGKYYLYAAHSERVPGTDKVRRISDGYLGRITEAEGFIPAKKKLPEDIRVYEYGLSETIISLCAKIFTGLKREFRANADFVAVGGVLLFMHDDIRQAFYESSWLSVRFPGLDMDRRPTGKQRIGMVRTQRMVEDVLTNHFGEGYGTAVCLLPLVRAACTSGEKAVAAIPQDVSIFMKKYNLNFKED
jgi:hypothetical protein